MSDMRRRAFITLLGGAAAAWPVAARAQQPATPVVGFLNPASANASADRLRGFRQGLKDSGYLEGENLTILYRWAENEFDRLSALASELVMITEVTSCNQRLGTRAVLSLSSF